MADLKKHIISITGVFFISLPMLSTALEHNSTHSTPNSQSKVTEVLTKELNNLHKKSGFAGSVMITSKGNTLLNQSYGFADQSGNNKNTTRTISDMGSVAKTFTAAAILKLISQDKLSLSTPITNIFQSVPDNKKSITIKGLLSHDSGLENFHNETDFDVMSKTQALNKILALPMLAEEGQEIAYSNAAYTLLAIIVEKITQQPFQHYVHQNLLMPLGLTNTGFYGDPSITINKLAKGYGGDNPGQTTFEKGLTWALIGQGGMVTSMDDLKTWFEAIINGTAISGSVENTMLSPANKKWLLGNIRHFSSWGALSYYAGGSTDYGYTALLQYLPEQDVFIFILLNGYSDKYRNRTHQLLSKGHLLPILLKYLKN